MNRQLYRDPENRIFSGVCSGLAEYANLDVGLVRFLTVLAFIFSGGSVLVIYLVLAFALPERPVGVIYEKPNTKTGMKKKELNEYGLDESEYIIDPEDYVYEDKE